MINNQKNCPQWRIEVIPPALLHYRIHMRWTLTLTYDFNFQFQASYGHKQ